MPEALHTSFYIDAETFFHDLQLDLGIEQQVIAVDFGMDANAEAQFKIEILSGFRYIQEKVQFRAGGKFHEFGHGTGLAGIYFSGKPDHRRAAEYAADLTHQHHAVMHADALDRTFHGPGIVGVESGGKSEVLPAVLPDE